MGWAVWVFLASQAYECCPPVQGPSSIMARNSVELFFVVVSFFCRLVYVNFWGML